MNIATIVLKLILYMLNNLLKVVVTTMIAQDIPYFIERLCKTMITISTRYQMRKIELEIQQRYLEEWLADIDMIIQYESYLKTLAFTLSVCFSVTPSVKREMLADSLMNFNVNIITRTISFVLSTVSFFVTSLCLLATAFCFVFGIISLSTEAHSTMTLFAVGATFLFSARTIHIWLHEMIGKVQSHFSP